MWNRNENPAGAPSNARAEAGRYVPERTSTRGDDKECNVKVIVRCRPFSEKERNDKALYSAVKIHQSNKCVVVSRKEHSVPDKRYYFDGVCNEFTTQREIFELYVVPTLTDVLEGFNCTLFAYGQTGTGKTHTMEGDLGNLGSSKPGESSSDGVITLPEDAGIIPRCVQQIFERLETGMVEYSVKVSYLEIYNEELCDLLAMEGEERQLRLFDKTKSDTNGTNRGLAVAGLTEVAVNSMDDVYNVLNSAIKKRRVAETDLNKSSSRSHCIFTIVIHMRGTHSDDTFMKVGKLNLVDLAGSENIQRSGAMAHNARTKEAGMINQSLLTLGRVINALVEHSSYVPYRDSKLTRLLMESLGGKAKTCIIATVSPSSICNDETQSTLDYAHRAKNIKNRPQVNQKAYQGLIMKDMGTEIDRLKQQLASQRDRDGGVFLKTEDYEQLSNQNEKLSELQENLTRELEERRGKEEGLRTEMRTFKKEAMQAKQNLLVADKRLQSRTSLLSDASRMMKCAMARSVQHSEELIACQRSLDSSLDHQYRADLSATIMEKVLVYCLELFQSDLNKESSLHQSLKRDVLDIGQMALQATSSMDHLCLVFEEMVGKLDESEVLQEKNGNDLTICHDLLSKEVESHTNYLRRWLSGYCITDGEVETITKAFHSSMNEMITQGLRGTMESGCARLKECILCLRSTLVGPSQLDKLVENSDRYEGLCRKRYSDWFEDLTVTQIMPLRATIQSLHSELSDLKALQCQNDVIFGEEHDTLKTTIAHFTNQIAHLFQNNATKHQARSSQLDEKISNAQKRLDNALHHRFLNPDTMPKLSHELMNEMVSGTDSIRSEFRHNLIRSVEEERERVNTTVNEFASENSARLDDLTKQLELHSTSMTSRVDDFTTQLSSDLQAKGQETIESVHKSVTDYRSKCDKFLKLGLRRRKTDCTLRKETTKSCRDQREGFKQAIKNQVDLPLESISLKIGTAMKEKAKRAVELESITVAVEAIVPSLPTPKADHGTIRIPDEFLRNASLELHEALRNLSEPPMDLLPTGDEDDGSLPSCYPNLIAFVRLLVKTGMMQEAGISQLNTAWRSIRCTLGYAVAVTEKTSRRSMPSQSTRMQSPHTPSNIQFEESRRLSSVSMHGTVGEDKLATTSPACTAIFNSTNRHSSHTSSPDGRDAGGYTVLQPGEAQISVRAMFSLLFAYQMQRESNSNGDDVVMLDGTPNRASDLSDSSRCLALFEDTDSRLYHEELLNELAAHSVVQHHYSPPNEEAIVSRIEELPKTRDDPLRSWLLAKFEKNVRSVENPCPLDHRRSRSGTGGPYELFQRGSSTTPDGENDPPRHCAAIETNGPVRGRKRTMPDGRAADEASTGGRYKGLPDPLFSSEEALMSRGSEDR